MKKKIFILLSLFFVVSCQQPEVENPNETTNPSEKEDLTPKYIGVWKKGDFFISLSDNSVYAVYLNNNFIDAGIYTVDNNVLTGESLYSKDKITISLSQITSASLSAKVDFLSYAEIPDYIYWDDDYHDYAVKDSFTGQLNKSEETPVQLTNKLVGFSSTNLTYAGYNILTTFITPFIASQRVQGGQLRNEMRALHYILLEDKIYTQIWYNEETNRGSNTFNCNYMAVKIYNAVINGIQVDLE